MVIPSKDLGGMFEEQYPGQHKAGWEITNTAHEALAVAIKKHHLVRQYLTPALEFSVSPALIELPDEDDTESAASSSAPLTRRKRSTSQPGPVSTELQNQLQGALVPANPVLSRQLQTLQDVRDALERNEELMQLQIEKSDKRRPLKLVGTILGLASDGSIQEEDKYEISMKMGELLKKGEPTAQEIAEVARQIMQSRIAAQKPAQSHPKAVSTKQVLSRVDEALKQAKKKGK